ERSIMELVRRSRHEWTIYTGHYDRENTFPEFGRLHVIEAGRLSVRRDMASVLGVALAIMCRKLDLKGHDALVVWCDGMGDLITFRNRDLPVFNICSTPLRAVYDPAYVRQALKERGPLARLAFRAFQLVFDRFDRLAWQRYRGVVATSAEVKNRIVKGGLYKDGPGLRLFYPGVDWGAFAGEKTYDPFLLVPGRIMWTKNIELAIGAFLKAGMPRPWRLVIAGFLDEKSRGYLEKLKALARGSERVAFEVSPSDEKMMDLYRRASAVLFPPLNEDWGIVPIEAMASSKPVIANAAGGPGESVIHGKTGWLLDPDVQQWAGTLARLPDSGDLIRTMGENAREHARRYDWSRFAEGVDGSLETWMKERSS
ncbi:MAG: glycosyltransferase, partial [Thermodesulfobacteriota bacterium]